VWTKKYKESAGATKPFCREANLNLSTQTHYIDAIIETI